MDVNNKQTSRFVNISFELSLSHPVSAQDTWGLRLEEISPSVGSSLQSEFSMIKCNKKLSSVAMFM